MQPQENGQGPSFQKQVQALGQAFRSAFAPLAAYSSDYVAACLYAPSGDTPDAVDVVGGMATVNAGPDQKSFRKQHVINKKIYKAGTSIGETLEADRDLGFYRSGYRADHLCLNFRVEGAPQVPNIIQLVFQRPDFFAGSDPDAAYKQIKGKVKDAFHRAAIQPLLATVNRGLKQAGSRSAAPSGYSQNRDMFLVFSDVSGFEAVRKSLGADRTVSLMTALRERFSGIAEDHGGDLFRAEGDGFWLTFPVTDFDKAERAEFMQSQVFPAVYDLSAAYRAVKAGDEDIKTLDTALKTSVSCGRLTASSSGSRFQKGILNGDGFFVARNLAEAAPRNRDVVIFGHDLVDLLPAAERSALFPVSVPPEKMGQGQGLYLSP